MFGNLVNWLLDVPAPPVNSNEAINIYENTAQTWTNEKINALTPNPNVREWIKRQERENRPGGTLSIGHTTGHNTGGNSFVDFS